MKKDPGREEEEGLFLSFLLGTKCASREPRSIIGGAGERGEKHSSREIESTVYCSVGKKTKQEKYILKKLTSNANYSNFYLIKLK